MKMNTIDTLIDSIEVLAADTQASPEELMAALSFLIVKNMNANVSNLLKVHVGEKELNIRLRDAFTVKH